MRPLEILIPVLLAVYLLWPHPRPLAVRLLPALALLATLIHFWAEGYRWQMVPLYVLTPVLALSSLIKITQISDWPALASYLTLILLALSTALPILLPVPGIPTPSGPYQVGTSTYQLVDSSREEIYSEAGGPRKFMIQVWYPAELKATDHESPWVSNVDIYSPALAGFFKLPTFFFDHLALVKVPAYKDAQIAQTKTPFPVIIFSHGWQGFNAQNTGQALELVSRGYVVVGMQHPYGAVVTVFPDGSIAPNNPTALPADENDPNYEVIARKLVNQWAGDMSFTLDQLSAWNEASEHPFFQKLDLNKVGVYGHSTGGGAAIQFCGTDSRCKAVLGMDPFMRPVSQEVIDSGVSQPAFFMFSQSWAEDVQSKNNKLFNEFDSNVTNSFGVIEINGTKHYDFSDLPLLSPIAPQLGLKGPLNGKRVIEIVEAYLIDFFESTLNNTPSNLFQSKTRYSEVKFLK